MADLLTTKQLQEILQVDRTTIYRMADSGRIPAIKVGNQWRFPRQQIEAWLQKQSSAVTTPNAPPSKEQPTADIEIRQLFPLECIQLIQDSFADILGVMILVTDVDGNLVTKPSNACGFFVAAEESPEARKRCLELWVRMAREPSLMPRFVESHLGLLCARGLIAVEGEIKAMLVLGGIAPKKWPPDEQKLQDIAEDLGLDASVLEKHLAEVYTLSDEEQDGALPYVQRIADIFSHIANERNELFQRLHRIAEITQI
jgi:excisionase family DNA binding protein